MSTGTAAPALSYRRLLGALWVTRLLAGAVVGRLPTAMVAIALPLTLRRHGIGFALAGLATALFAAGQAAGGPVLSRIVDRHRQTAVLVTGGAVSSAAFLLIAALPAVRAPVLLGSFLAGVATPPIEPCLRALWPVLVGPANLQRAYSVDSAAQEVIFVSGPLLVAATVLIWRPELALVLAAAFGLVGTLVVAGTEPSRRWRGSPSGAGWMGPLRSGRLAVLLVGMAGCAVPVGGLAIVAVAYAEQHAVPGGAGVLLGVQAMGALTGAVLNGRVRWTAPPARRGVLLSAAMATAYLLLAVPAPVPVTMGVIFIAGSFLPPLLVIAFGLIDELAPEGTVVEAFAWLVTLFSVGVAGGSALAGAVRQALGTAPAAASLAVAGLAGTGVWLAFRRLGLREAGGAA